MNATVARRRANQGFLQGSLLALAALIVVGAFASGTVTGRADNFTDIFYTNSFRGAFTWIQKLDWVGMLVQIVISTFSLFGVALMTIRIMTSMLFLSAKGMWEEVHDLKSQGGSEEKDLFGLVGMGKSWVQGKAGTGLDAIVGAVLLILPDVKRYSDFGEKAGGDFSDDMTITQYILKIAVPTIMTVFFFAMGFNGTLFQALAVTVDFMGNMADKAISVNYTGIADDAINRITGYKFVFDLDGTNEGKWKQGLAKDIFGRVVSKVRGADAVTLENAGNAIEDWVGEIAQAAPEAPQLSERVKTGFQGDAKDQYWQYVGYNVEFSNKEAAGALKSRPLSELVAGNVTTDGNDGGLYVNVFIRQSGSYNGSGMFAGLGDSGNNGGTAAPSTP